MTTPTSTTGNRWWQLAIVFISGLALGAAGMVEAVPSSVTATTAAADTARGDGDAVPTSGRPAASDPASAGDVGARAPGAASPEPAAGGDAASTARDAGEASTTDPGTTTTAGTTSAPGTSAEPSAPTEGDEPELACAPGRNGGATDRGVTANEIQLATTVVESGPGSSFLGEARYAMEAVVQKVNRSGGICGRMLKVTYRDDGWKADRGAQYLRNFIDQGVFAIPVGPSSEGLNAVIASGDFDRAQVPVVGTDGLTIKQYEREDGSAQPWVWPVAVATVSSARIMATDAYNRGARDFSIVFDSNYKFGVEAAEAFNAQVRELTGEDIDGYQSGATSCNRSFCGIAAGQPSYSGQVSSFEEGDFVALFLEPDTALKWMSDQNAPKASDPSIPYGYGAAQPLFTRGFAERCKAKCHGMVVWSGFKPFVEDYRSDPAVQTYVNDLHRANPNADEANQFSEGAYLGMQLFVEALREAGPNLTRQRVQAALDHLRFENGLTLRDPLTYSPDNRYVATTMQGWTIQYSGTFAGWRAGNTVSDPAFGG